MVALRLALASVALSGAALAAPVDLSTRQVTCQTGAYIIVARGSNEDPGEGAASAVADLVEGLVPGSASVAVDYPASITGPLYPQSVTEGMNDATAKITAYVDACGSASKIVLVGYSQGGNVLTNVLAGGVGKPDPISADYAQYVTAVAVFGDPTFTADQSFNVGTSTNDGIFSRREEGDSLELLLQYASKIQSYCDEGDPFCAGGTDGDVHSNTIPKYAEQAANFIASKNQGI